MLSKQTKAGHSPVSREDRWLMTAESASASVAAHAACATATYETADDDPRQSACFLLPLIPRGAASLLSTVFLLACLRCLPRNRLRKSTALSEAWRPRLLSIAWHRQTAARQTRVRNLSYTNCIGEITDLHRFAQPTQWLDSTMGRFVSTPSQASSSLDVVTPPCRSSCPAAFVVLTAAQI
jgi:hypothetical protein